MKRTMGTAAALLVFVLAGCGHRTDHRIAAGNDLENASAAAGNMMSDAADSVTQALSPVPNGQEFADKAVKSDAFEIAAAKLAEEKADDADIKGFAAMMIEDHTASTSKISKAANKAHPAISPNSALTDDLNAKLADLGRLTGGAFDREYVRQQVNAHEKALSLMSLYAAKGEVAPLKAAAGEIEPRVRAHLDRIKSIGDRLNR